MHIIKEDLINESPDGFISSDGIKYSLNAESGTSYSFEVILNTNTKKIADVLFSNRPNSGHGTDDITKGHYSGNKDTNVSYDIKSSRYNFNWQKIYPGRLFMKPKIITFWIYPTASELKTIIKIIEKKKDIKMFFNDWRIEVYKEGLKNKGAKEYNNNYDRSSSDIEFIPIEKYIGSKKPPTVEYLQHLDTKTKHEVPFGYGSRNPVYQSKRQWQMASATEEGKEEDFYPKLFENPDKVHLPNGELHKWNESKAEAFGYIRGKFYVGHNQSKHYEIALTAERNNFKYPGRIWLKKKIISFWTYPNVIIFKDIINNLENKLKIKIWDDLEYKVEIIRKKKSNEILKRGNFKKSEWGIWQDFDSNNLKIDWVHPKNYVKSENFPEKERKLQHLDMTHKHEVPFGYGSKNPAYQTKRQWQMASVTDESFKNNT